MSSLILLSVCMFELANPGRQVRVKIGPDEGPEVRKAVAAMIEEVKRKTGACQGRGVRGQALREVMVFDGCCLFSAN